MCEVSFSACNDTYIRVAFYTYYPLLSRMILNTIIRDGSDGIMVMSHSMSICGIFYSCIHPSYHNSVSSSHNP